MTCAGETADPSLLDTWQLRQDLAARASGTQPAPVKRQPRRRTVLIEQTRLRVAAAKATAAVAGHEPAGPASDPPLE
jgi:hypothetical protein